MKSKVDWKSNSYIIWAIIGVCIIFVFYASYALRIHTVWSLVDEYGYLANAAYLSGTKWTSLTNLYYGWGYSVLLLPLFWIGANGTTIIRGAILVNALCTAVTYWLQIVLLSKLCKNLNKHIVVLMAFALSFFPYVMASNTKVMPDSLLVFMLWLCGLALYKALETKHVGWYGLLALCMAYIFFVHTRSFVFVGTWILMLMLMTALKEVNWKHLLIFLALFAVFYFAGYALKDALIENFYSKAIGMEDAQGNVATIGNMLSIEMIIARIKRVFTSKIWIYLKSFVCKFFYTAVATVGTWQLGVYAVTKNCINKWKQHMSLSASEWVKVGFVAASVMMIGATAIQSPGSADAVGYYFYGRYYEYLVLPVAALGMEYFIDTEIKWKTHLIHMAIVIASSMGAFLIYPSLETKIASLDTARMPAFSALACDIDYCKMISGYLLITVLALLLGAILNHKKAVRWIFILVILAGFAFNNASISKVVIDINEDVFVDNVIAEHVVENIQEEYVYYLDAESVIHTSRMQVLLGKKQLKVIDIEELEGLSGCYLLAQTASRYHEELSEFEKVMTGFYYELYYIK